MAHKSTGVRHQDENPDPHSNKKWGEKGFQQGQGQGSSESGYEGREEIKSDQPQENLENRGFQEDQPKNPVRSTGSLARDQQKDTYNQLGDDENK